MLSRLSLWYLILECIKLLNISNSCQCLCHTERGMDKNPWCSQWKTECRTPEDSLVTILDALWLILPETDTAKDWLTTKDWYYQRLILPKGDWTRHWIFNDTELDVMIVDHLTWTFITWSSLKNILSLLPFSTSFFLFHPSIDSHWYWMGTSFFSILLFQWLPSSLSLSLCCVHLSFSFLLLCLHLFLLCSFLLSFFAIFFFPCLQFSSFLPCCLQPLFALLLHLFHCLFPPCLGCCAWWSWWHWNWMRG